MPDVAAEERRPEVTVAAAAQNLAVPVVITGKKGCRAEYRELLSVKAYVEDGGSGGQEHMVPMYGRVIAESGQLPRKAWKPGVSVADFVESILGPPPHVLPE